MYSLSTCVLSLTPPKACRRSCPSPGRAGSRASSHPRSCSAPTRCYPVARIIVLLHATTTINNKANNTIPGSIPVICISLL